MLVNHFLDHLVAASQFLDALDAVEFRQQPDPGVRIGENHAENKPRISK
jgi:hypothetical protein